MKQGSMKAQQMGLKWEDLPRQQQWHMAWTTGPAELWETLRMVHISALIISVIIVGFILWLGVVRWRLALAVQGLKLPLGRATNISLVAQFFNSFLLGSTGGDLIKAYYAARETHHLKAEAVTTVFVDRLVGLWSMLLFAGVMMLPNIAMLTARRELAAPALFILAMLVGVTITLTLAFWGGVTKRLPQARLYLRKLPKGELLERSLDSCRQYGRHKGFLVKGIANSLFVNVLWVAQVAVLGWGLDLHIPWVELSAIVPIILCISALPITPNGLGVRESLFVMMLGVLLVPKGSALSLSLIVSAEGLFWSLVGGVVYMSLRQKEHLTGITENTIEEPQ